MTAKNGGEDTGPDPLRLCEDLRRAHGVQAAEPLRVSFPLVTEGREPGIDAVGIMCAVLGPLTPKDRAAAIAYVIGRYGVDT